MAGIEAEMESLERTEEQNPEEHKWDQEVEELATTPEEVQEEVEDQARRKGGEEHFIFQGV